MDDFNDCNDDGWTHVGHRIGGQDAPGGTWDATFVHEGSCAYRLSTAETNTSAAIVAAWEGSSDTKFSEGYFRARVRPETDGTAITMAMRAVPFGDGYLGEILLDRGIMRIRDHEAGPSSIVQTQIDISANDDWFMQIGTVGDEFSLKAWPVGEPEPSSPQLTATYSSRTTGLFAIATGVPPGGGGTGSTVFDDIVFIPEPSTSILSAIGLLAVLAFSRRL